MKIELLDEKTVKVVLSRVDMNNFQMTYDEMDYKKPETKKVLSKLIDQIKKEVSIDLAAGKLFIEAFPYADGGCILYVNVLDIINPLRTSSKRNKTSFDTPLIYCFNDIDSLGKICKRLNQQYSHIILRNSLYLLDDNYYLLIYTYFKMDAELSHMLDEYGKFYGKGSVASAVVKEHSKELIKTDAIQLLERCLD